jgi:puromycin-sensitive aminopeptidase
VPADDQHRLPRSVVPLRYDLELAPDLERATFRGSVTIEVDVLEPVEQVVLHAVDLDIDSAWIGRDGTALDVGIEPDPELERVALVAPEPLARGTAELHLSFSGSLDQRLVGFYRSTFTVPDPDDPDGPGTEHAVAVTQFQSTHARRCFPCFDEPDLKAVFGVSVVVDDGLCAVSNAAEVARSPAGDGTVRICFADTIRMPTYLVAVVVGPFEVTEAAPVAGRGGPIPLRVVHPPGAGRLTAFALEVADAGIRFFEDYYDLPYPGDKVDLVAVPDFAFGAMENLGCITFREVLLLVDTAHATPQDLQRVAQVINHELAHMWFGDLVTMRWWNGIWLNEAFATFMEVAATDAFRPEWDAWTAFGLARSAAFDTDALDSTRPIEFEVATPEDAEGMFDVLTYEKGASVVRMLERYLGPERFRNGIRAYLRQHALGNTDTTDLWDALEASTGEPVRRIMDAWILRGGHPLVVVEPTEGGMTLRQERFRYRPDDPDPVAWPVPLVLDLGGGRTEQLLLEGPATVMPEVWPAAAWVNRSGDGFFRTDLTGGLRTALADPGRPPLERFVLIDDTWALVLAGRVEVTEFVGVLERLVPAEHDPAIWRRVAAALRELRRLAGGAHASEVASLCRRLAGPTLDRVEAELTRGDRSSTAGDRDACWDLRGVVFAVLGTVGEDAALRLRARQLFADEDAEPALRAAALEVVAATASAAEHLEIEAKWRNATTPQDELRYLQALAETPSAADLDRLLALALDEVRSQNAPFLFRRAIAHPELGRRAWQFVSSHWDRITGRIPSSAVPRMLEGVRTITDEDLAAAVRDFLGDHPVLAGERTVVQHLERMEVTVAAARRIRDAWTVGALGTEPG